MAGLLVEKIEVGGPGDFDRCETVEQIANHWLDLMAERFLPVDQADKEALIELAERHHQEVQEFLASIEARPIVAYRVDTRKLDRPWQHHEPLTIRRLSYNGSKTGSHKQAKPHEREREVIKAVKED